MFRPALAVFSSHPLTVWLTLALAALAIQVAIDMAMGDAAEYFNAFEVLLAWAELLLGRDPLGRQFLMGQARLGAWALPAGTALLIAQPLGIGGVILLAGQQAGRLLG